MKNRVFPVAPDHGAPILINISLRGTQNENMSSNKMNQENFSTIIPYRQVKYYHHIHEL